MESLIHIDLFSGVGGFAKGFQDAGVKFDHHYYSEIDKHAIAVYKYQFKESKYVGSVVDVSGRELRERHPGAKFIVTFGFPCQDLSIAGKGVGLNGKRSGLFFEAIRIITELGAEVFIFENVKGLLSSNQGKDFETVLRTIADLGVYECEWQLVNTAWVLPQNRERVYFIGHFGGRSRPRVFPFRESDPEFSFQHKGIKNVRDLLILRWQNTNDGLVLSKTAPTLKANPKGGCRNNPSVVQRGRGFNKGGNHIKINSNTKSGYELAKDGDGVRFDHLIENSTGRARVQKQVAHTLDLSATQGVLLESNIRRLTETECERLQGFPDGWTAIGDYDGEIKKVSKTQRYKQMGNAVTTNWPRNIANRLFNN